MRVHNKAVIVICGPTAVGKTSLAIELAQQLQTEIISADSRQCFKELNIGVAKPNPVELELVKHHFINSNHVTDDVNAVSFATFALEKAAAIFSTHDTVILVGGTGLYIKAFCEGLDEIPHVPAGIRQKIVVDYEMYGLSWFQQQVQLVDPHFWQLAEQSNPHRLIRALEIKMATNRSITAFRTGNSIQRPFDILKVGLELPRSGLHQNIHQRVDNMIAAGLVAEAESLLPYRHLPALQTVGYRELFDFFDGTCSLEKAIEKIKTNTRHYAKRQLTWFKKDLSVRWYTAGERLNQQNITNILQQLNET